MAISNFIPGSHMHNWLVIKMWRLYYHVGNIFMEHIRTIIAVKQSLTYVRYLNIADQVQLFMTTRYPVDYCICQKVMHYVIRVQSLRSDSRGIIVRFKSCIGFQIDLT